MRVKLRGESNVYISLAASRLLQRTSKTLPFQLRGSLLSRWKHIDPEDALLLLLPEFTADAVREHAVEALRRASNEELLMYLLQLVQVRLNY